MKKEVSKKLNLVLEWGLNGLKISLIILLILSFLLILFSLETYPQNKFFSIILKLPETKVDFLAMLGGVIVFIALPFLIGIEMGLKSKKDSKRN